MLTEKGFNRPTYDDILKQLINSTITAFGADFDTSELTAYGQLLRVVAKEYDDMWQSIEGSYLSRFPNTSNGVNLERAVSYASISRNAATRARHEMSIVGRPGTTIPVGFLVSTETKKTFYSLNEIVLDSNGMGDGIFEATVPGSYGNVALGSINTIVNPNEYVTSVNHVQQTMFANNEETDSELRQRYRNSLQASGSGTRNAIISNVLRVPGVSNISIVENDEDFEVDGRPSKSFETYVWGGDEQEIAEAIFDKMPVTVRTFGKISRPVTDLSGNEVNISFSRTETVDIYLKVFARVNSTFSPTDGVTQIKDNLVRKIGGILTDGTATSGLNSGAKVPITTLYGCVYDVPGVVEVDWSWIAVSFDKGNTWGIETKYGQPEIITLKSYEILRVNADNIEVTLYNE